MIYADTETHLISDTEPVPRLVVSALFDGSNAMLLPREQLTHEQVRALLLRPICFANAPYDLLVWLRAYPAILHQLINALERGTVHDVLLREKMIDHAYGARTAASRYDLGTVARVRAGDVSVDKSDPFRLLYGGLDGVPLDLWPTGARDYAIGDAVALAPIFAEQDKHADLLTDEPRQVRAAVALEAMSARGMQLDRDRVQTLERLFAARRDTLEQELIGAGLARLKFKKKRPSPIVREQKKARELIVQLAADTGQEYVRTDKGHAALSAEALEALHVPADHPLAIYRALGSLQAKGRTYLEPMHDRDVIRTRFDPCVVTNRTSSSGPNLQNLPRDVLQWLSADVLPTIEPGIEYPSKRALKPRPLGFRECIVPRPGFVFVTSDWSMMELVVLAQECLRLFGWSKLAEALQAGRDAHEELGSTIAGFDIRGRPERKLYRTLAKAPNFGFPGGLGVARFVDWANAVYGEQLREYGVVIDEKRAAELKQHWRQQWPEMILYHKRIGALTAGEQTATMQLRSGYVRGGMRFTDASNFPFQGGAAAIAKDALWHCWRESVTERGALAGAYPVHFVHDEIVIESPIDRAWEHAGQLERIMIEALRRGCPDVPGGVETMITSCYTK